MMAVYGTIFLFLAISTASAWENCPGKSLFDPCDCHMKGNYFYDVVCSRISTARELQRVMDNTAGYPFDLFTLTDSSILHLNTTWFVQKSIKFLSLSNSTLVSLFDHVSDVTLPLVTDIWVYNTSLQVLWSGFKPFVNLGALSVVETEVDRLGKEFRENVTSKLKLLNMYRTETKVLEDGVFAGKKNLSMIAIQRGKLRILKNSYFEDLKEVLRDLDLSYNPIEFLPDDMFQGMEALEIVDLKGANIKTLIKEAYFGGYLNLEENPLVCDCKMSWVTTTYRPLIDGTCVSPPNLNSKQLNHLTKENFQACRNMPLDY